MPSPFPGMDPYLEKPALWPDVHHELISQIRATLNRQLDRTYYAQIQERVFISTDEDTGRIVLVPDIKVSSQPSGSPSAISAEDRGGQEMSEPLLVETLIDEEIREHFLEVIDTENRRVVTVIEVLSPDNKVSRSQGLESFRKKRTTIMRSRSHWVEIDLLRRGVSLALRKRLRPHDYFVHISPVGLRPSGQVWPIRLSQRLPVIQIPLRGQEKTPLDLQVLLDTSYDHAGYARAIDYTSEPVPPLSKEWKEWADRLLREKGLRGPTEASH
jgi:Protein of unknown function (DUF4058)